MDDYFVASIEDAKRVIENATDVLAKITGRLERATDLLRMWRDKYGGREHYTFSSPYGNPATASPTDLIVATQKFLEGK